MRQTRTRKVYIATPRGCVRLAPWLWGLWTCAVLIAFGWGAYAALVDQAIPSYRSYTGELRPSREPSTLSLPVGVFVDEMLIERNDVVRKGQTLITLDYEAMSNRLRILEEDMAQDRLLQHCLVYDDYHLKRPVIPDIPTIEIKDQAPDPSQETRLSMTLALCDSHYTKVTSIQEKLQEHLAVLEEEKLLIEQFIRLLTNSMSQEITPEEEEKNTRQALAFALARNQLDAQKTALKHKARADLADLQSQRLSLAEKIGDRLRVGESLRDQLKKNLERPRLQAPETGVVVRARTLPKGMEVTETTEVVEIRPEETQGYSAYFTIPPEHVEGLVTGAEVRLKIHGMPGQRGFLNGTISAMVLDVAGRPQATVVLSPESAEKLDDPRTGIALRGPGTASVIYVQRTDLKPLNTLKTELVNGILRKPKWIFGEVVQQIWHEARLHYVPYFSPGEAPAAMINHDEIRKTVF